MEQIVHCRLCGEEEELGPGFALPESGGAVSVQEDRVTEFICGPCWRARQPDVWTCAQCGKSNPQWTNYCGGCHQARPDPRPYVPDWDLIAKEQQERQRRAEQQAWEWDQEFPGWRFARAGRRDRL